MPGSTYNLDIIQLNNLPLNQAMDSLQAVFGTIQYILYSVQAVLQIQLIYKPTLKEFLTVS